MANNDKSPAEVVVVGAGLGGISTAIALKKKFGPDSFMIFEKAASVGGTWRDNTYPGCGSDAVAAWYSHSEFLNPNWNTPYATQAELKAYWTGIFDSNNLARNTRFSTSVVSAVWLPDRNCYEINLKDERSGSLPEFFHAKAVIYATGGFMGAKFPDIENISAFRGLSFHSSQWPHDKANFSGKTVGIVGNACSVAQFLPIVAEDPTVQVINFCRTPQWFIERDNTPFSSWNKWIFANVPLVMRWYRNYLMARMDMRSLLVFHQGSPLLFLVRWLFIQYLKKEAPPDQLDRLIPDYPPGCKRIIVDPGYLAALKRPNVTVKWDLIQSFLPDGVVLSNGEQIPLDVIIFGTGYNTDPVDLNVRGREGSYQEHKRDMGRPTAYLGTAIPGFPNMFTILGPNVATGHASVVFSEEVQINLIIERLEPVIRGEAKSVEIRKEVHDRYNDWLQRALKDTVWMQCSSYYQVDGKPGPIVATFPGPVTRFWWLAKRDTWNNWILDGGDAWIRKQRFKFSLSTSIWMVIVGTIVSQVCVKYLSK